MSIEERTAEAEVEQLRARVRELEDELAEVSAWAHRAVAEAQDKTYWLDRWQVDVNALMRHRAADWLRGAARGVRWVFRRARRLQHRFHL